MTTLVIGASGSTGKHLVDQLLQSNQQVKVIVRSPEKLPESWKTNKQLSIFQANVSEITVDEMAKYVKDCNAIASCLGHSLTWQGMYGKPRKLVTDAVSLTCRAILKNAPNNPVKVVLMNTSGNRNRDLNEPNSVGERIVVSLLRLLIPPHVDNEKAADYLRTKIGQENNLIQWVAVRPDALINEDKVSEYQVFPSPTRSAFFNAGKVSRINVGHFMAKLITEKDLWAKWKGQMPVIYKSA
ncbi:NAD(P)-dependent oxidoreductase [Cyclobacterium sp. SYSU L10401]|uniref:NAD(P)-dependent oxidoreductase n=1 Tax=Cyclobacterium sp. SYSU L10401 TaxID=2678657 RepID=UPI0013CF70C7|nr:NAD(P)-binding oxidoreductase [Cyclobacterium sp. SYSU L10401]